MNTQIVDPFAKVHARRDEKIAASAEKERELLERIAATKQQALDLRGDADKLARSHHTQRANDLRAHAEQLETEARKLTSVDLPRLRIEAENIRQLRDPELSALNTAANLRSRSTQEDQKRAACNALTEAKSALYEHLARLATGETLRLAHAVAAAELAADVEHEDSVQVLITMLDPKAAA